jgi:D-amino-acid dehydrogenase
MECIQSERSFVKTLIIGAGVVGTATGLELARRGVDVTVVDRSGVGRGCSFGNAGWLTPCFATPLPAPGVLTTSLRWLLDPESPLYVKPSFSIEWLRWITRFALSTSEEKFESGARALVALSRYSLDAYAALDGEYPGDFSFERRGLIHLAQTPRGLEGARHDARIVEANGVEARVLDEQEVRELEPAITGEACGGVYFPEASHYEPFAAVRTLARAAEAAGARFVDEAEVFGFQTEDRRLRAVETTRGLMEADRFVLATGSWSMPLARRLGIRIPILGGKGYSIVVKGLERAPRIPIKIYERKIAITPRSDSLRLAGTLELVDGDESITARRLEAILKGSRTALDIPLEPEIADIWRGLRPCTPDGLPVIGFAPRLDNLLIATGHQMVGMHTAPATGRLAADLLTGSAPIFPPEPFRADRFQT